MTGIRSRALLVWATVLVAWLGLASGTAHAGPKPNPAILWQTSIGSHADDCFHAVEPTSDGGCIAVGFTTLPPADTRTDHGRRELLAVRFAADGSQLWRKTFGGREEDEACDLVVLTDDSSLLVGSTRSPQGDVTGFRGGRDLWAVRLDRSGNLLWQKTYGGGNDDSGFAVITTETGGYVLAGATTSNDGDVSGNLGGSDAWLLGIDGTGNLLWQRCFGGAGEDMAFGVTRGIDDGFVAVGRLDRLPTAEDVETQANGLGNVLAAKITATGTLVWQSDFGGWEEDVGYGITTAPDSTYIITGMSRSYNASDRDHLGGDDAWVLDIDTTGHMLWNRVFGGWADDTLRSIRPVGDGSSFVCAGSTSSANASGDVQGVHPGSSDVWLVSIDAEGSLLWQRCLGGGNTDAGYDAYGLEDGSFCLVGAGSPKGEGDITGGGTGQDAWILTVTEGDPVTTGEPMRRNDRNKRR
ncbi:MAG TPA: hypothetical protein PLP29_14655 [Candidatus Ozemobacteraceae bacterium]|nr:hypothetical protein [Candidatus Ozemobacteraceae bacterium]